VAYQDNECRNAAQPVERPEALFPHPGKVVSVRYRVVSSRTGEHPQRQGIPRFLFDGPFPLNRELERRRGRRGLGIDKQQRPPTSDRKLTATAPPGSR
jgi:hypothetical protein